MNSRIFIAGLVIGLSMPLQSIATAETLSSELVIGGGFVHFLQEDHGTQWMGVIEYRFQEVKWDLRPWVGVAYAEGGTNFASAGLLYTKAMANGLRFSVGFAPSYYEPGNGRDLGNDLNFYSFAEAGYVLKSSHVVSLRIGHLSNGGLADRNPGTETVQLSYSLPLGRRN
jgi:hypothetical protein